MADPTYKSLSKAANTPGLLPEQQANLKNLATSLQEPRQADEAPDTSSPSPYYPRYTPAEQAATNYLDKSSFTAPKSEEQIYQQKAKLAQGQIDALTNHYNAVFKEQQTINEGRDRSTASVNTLTGLAGSTEANVQQGKTTALNQKDNERILAEKNLAVQSLLGQIRASAVEEARQQRLDARADAESVLKRRTDRQTEAATQLTTLAQSGATADGLKATDPESYAYLAQALGGEETLKAMFTLNRPQETILDKRVENGRYVIAWQNPLDGKIRIDTLDLGLPPEYTKTIDAGDRILAMPANWDGDPSKLITINKGMSPASTSGLSSKQYTALNQITTRFQADPIINQALKGNTASQIADQVIANPESATSQLKSLYVLVKNLDPDSAVREGELALANQTQSYFEQFKNTIARINEGRVISPDAASALATATKELMSAWNNTAQKRQQQYQSQAGVLGISEDFDSYIQGSGLGYNSSGASRVLVKDGQAFDASELTDEEFQQALSEGYSEQ